MVPPAEPPRSRPFRGWPWLAPLGSLVARGARFRRHHLSRSAESLPAPVISVGNLTVGGTGKTPVVEMVVRALRDRGRVPAVLSRGYGAEAGSEGRNDEFHLLEENVPGLIQVPDPLRVRGGRRALESGADVLVLDDGFQHVRLARDLDLVLIDAVDPFGNGHVLPAGRLRESLDTLELADLFLITRADAVSRDRLGRLRTFLSWRFPSVPRAEVCFPPRAWRSVSGEEEIEVESLAGQRVMAFSGIGHPGAFRAGLERLGLEIAGWRSFPDHHAYSGADVELLEREAARVDAGVLVFTQKDAVKLKRLVRSGDGRWWQLLITAELTRGQATFERLLGEAIRGKAE